MTKPSRHSTRAGKDIPLEALDFNALLRPGDNVVVGQMSGEPLALTQALVRQRHTLERVEVFVGVLGETAFVPDAADRLRFRSFGAMGAARPLHRRGALAVVPIALGQVARAIDEHGIACDVTLVQLVPTADPDRFAFAMTCDYLPTAMNHARLVVAEINAAAPLIPGADTVHRREIDILVRTDRAIPPWPSRPPSEVDARIATLVADLVLDEATLQIGIGGVPDAVMAMLRDRRDLGYHAGLLGDGTAQLMQAGALTNARKTIDPGKSVTAMVAGSDALLRYVDGNPAIALRPSSYTNALSVIAAQHRFVAINSALQVDLTGAVNAEAITGDQIGGTGGLPDFVAGAMAAPHGRSIIALPASASGSASRIVARLDGPTTLPGHMADIVVTEHGRAELRGKSIEERTAALIAIATPQARDRLRATATMASY